jgi:hypothetical protein
MSINARINTHNDTACLINSHSIMHNVTGDYLFIKQNGNYTKIKIIKGNPVGELTEISGFPCEISDSLVTKGIVYLNSLFMRD